MKFASRFTRRVAMGVAAIGLGSLCASHAFADSTISAVQAGGAGTYTIDNAEVVEVLDIYGTSSNNVVLQDSTGSILLYSVSQTYGLAAGDNITLSASNSPYQDGAELKTVTALTINSTGNAVPDPTVLTVAQFNAASNTSGTGPNAQSMVTLDGVSFTALNTGSTAQNTSYTFTDGTGSGIGYLYKSDSAVGETGYAVDANNGLAQLLALNAPAGTPLNLTGFVDNYFGTSEFYITGATFVPAPTTVPAVVAGFGLLGGLYLARRRRQVAL